MKVQCVAAGNPAPRLTWSKRGPKGEHTTIDDDAGTLELRDVDESHADAYSCTASNDVGAPVTSDFRVHVRFGPRVAVVKQDGLVEGVLYSAVGRREQIRCQAAAYPAPTLRLLFNKSEVVATVDAADQQQDQDSKEVSVKIHKRYFIHS